MRHASGALYLLYWARRERRRCVRARRVLLQCDRPASSFGALLVLCDLASDEMIRKDDRGLEGAAAFGARETLAKSLTACKPCLDRAPLVRVAVGRDDRIDHELSSDGSSGTLYVDTSISDGSSGALYVDTSISDGQTSSGRSSGSLAFRGLRRFFFFFALSRFASLVAFSVSISKSRAAIVASASSCFFFISARAASISLSRAFLARTPVACAYSLSTVIGTSDASIAITIPAAVAASASGATFASATSLSGAALSASAVTWSSTAG
eukprot:6411356-Prymnesium_polylepis.2